MNELKLDIYKHLLAHLNTNALTEGREKRIASYVIGRVLRGLV